MNLVDNYPGDPLIFLLVCDVMKGVFWLKPGRKEEAEKRRAGAVRHRRTYGPLTALFKAELTVANI